MAVHGARIAAKVIASQLLILETEVGRVRSFPVATERAKEGALEKAWRATPWSCGLFDVVDAGSWLLGSLPPTLFPTVISVGQLEVKSTLIDKHKPFEIYGT
jgi:hypothetical protein